MGSIVKEDKAVYRAILGDLRTALPSCRVLIRDGQKTSWSEVGTEKEWQLGTRVKLQKLLHQRQTSVVLQEVHDSKFIFLCVCRITSLPNGIKDM